MYVWWKLAVVGFIALAGLAKVVSAVGQRDAARRRVQGGQREIADNTPVTLVGTVKLVGDPLIAPLSGTPCVYHRSTARVLPVRGASASAQFAHTRPEATLSQMVTFVLVTRDGEIRVDAEDAETTLRPGAIVPRKVEREMEFLRRAGFDQDPRNTGFDEVVITEGMKIAVHGIARIEMVPGESTFRETARSVRLVGDAKHPLTIDRA